MTGREKRHNRIRKKVFGTKEKPRLSVFRSLRHFYAQLVDDIASRTLFALSTLDERLDKKLKNRDNVKAAASLGELFAQGALSKGYEKVIFDRGGYLYHGRVKAFAEAARTAGLKF